MFFFFYTSMLIYILYCLIIVDILASLIYKSLEKFYRKEKKHIAESMQKSFSGMQIMTAKNNDSANALSSRRFKLGDFSTNFIWYCSIYMLDTFYLWGFFPSITLRNYATELPQNWTDEYRAWLARVQPNWVRLARHISLARKVTYHFYCVFRNSTW